MNGDTSERALKEAEGWLVSAKDKLIQAREDEVLANVVCAQAIHAIIRANDALTLKFLKVKTTRHDDATVLFVKMIKSKNIADSDTRFKEVLARIVRDKSGADYGKKQFSLEEAEAYVNDAEEFVNMAIKYV